MVPQKKAYTKPSTYVVLLLPDLVDGSFFSPELGETLHDSVINAIKDEENPEIKFEFYGYDRGRYKVVCANLASKDWALKIVPKRPRTFW